MNDRSVIESFEQYLKWNRDVQYYHELIKWMYVFKANFDVAKKLTRKMR